MCLKSQLLIIILLKKYIHIIYNIEIIYKNVLIETNNTPI